MLLAHWERLSGTRKQFSHILGLLFLHSPPHASFFSSCRLCLPLWSEAVGRCLMTGKSPPAKAKVASQTLSSTTAMARMRRSKALTPTQRAKRAGAHQAHRRTSLWTNRSCSAAWSTSSSFSPDSSPCILRRGRRTKLRVKEVRS